MHDVIIAFWVCASIIFYNYIGYGLILAILVKIRSPFHTHPTAGADFTPAVTLVIAAYNEEEFIRSKISNSLDLDYPADLFHILVVTDGSTDRTPDLVRGNSRVILLHEGRRLGKTSAINRAMKHIQTPIVIFSDANTLLNRQAIRMIVQHYGNPQVGGVAGEKKVIDSGNRGGSGAGEGLYWKYESWLKKLDARLFTIVGAAGELFSIRSELYEPVEPDVILDDFMISLRICAKGYRIAYEPNAYAMETASVSMAEEQKRKIRICAGGFQSIFLLKGLLNPFRQPLLTFQYISHRVLRWTFAPLCLPVILFLNVILVAGGNGVIYLVSLIVQILFYGFALSGLYLAPRNRMNRLLQVPYYFLFMNIMVYLGFFRFLSRHQSSVWEKASREKWKGDSPVT